MIIEARKSEPNGAPLTVCVNDCQLDYGQPRSQLAPLCFRVNCAFAGMRWGKSDQGGCLVPPQQQQILQIVSSKF